MSLSTRLQTSWQLLRRSLEVLRGNPRLVLFPIVSAVGSILLGLVFFAPVVALGIRDGWGAEHDWKAFGQTYARFFYVYGAGIYLVSLFVATFSNVAFYAEIMRALGGAPVSLSRGFRFAFSRLPAILLWSLLAGTVGLIIRAIEERLGWLGRIGMALVGTAWSIAAVFAIPVIIRRDDANPLGVLRDSAASLKKTWGESLAGYVGIQLAGAAAVLVVLFFGLAATVVAVKLHLTWLAIGVVVLWLLLIIAVGLLAGMAGHIYRCALYVYASEGVIPAPYTAEMMDAGWKIKKA